LGGFAGDQSQELKLATPEERVAQGVLWAMRVDINPSFETPLSFLVESTEKSTRITVYRFITDARKSADVDLLYSFTTASMSLPDWLFKLSEEDHVHGLDGVSVRMHIVASGRSRVIGRWNPNANTKERGLEEYVGLIATLIDTTGVKPRHMLERLMLEDSVEFSIPVPPAFMAAAERIQEKHHESVGSILEKSYHRASSDSNIVLDMRRKVVRGKAAQRVAVDLTALIGSFTQASERYIVSQFDDLVAASTVEDPFAAPTQRQEDAEPADSGQPATKPADKPPVKDQPSTPTSKVVPR
jgi:hypothetical protein